MSNFRIWQLKNVKKLINLLIFQIMKFQKFLEFNFEKF